MSASKDACTVIRYVAYDKTTGQIIHTHSQFDVQENRHVEIPVDKLKEMFSKEQDILRKLSENNSDNLEFLKIELASAGEPLSAAMVDPVRKVLVHKSHLALSASKRELAGDGQDTARIEIFVRDKDGDPVFDASGAVAEIAP